MQRSTLVAAAVLCAASACGGSKPSGDLVTVTVLDGAPAAGVEVVFLGPDGSLAARAVTDAQGKASAAVERGGSVTVARLEPGVGGPWNIVTIAEVEPGDAPVLDIRLGSGGALVGHAQVTFPGPFAGATEYSANLGCSDSAWRAAPVPVSVALFPGCGSGIDAIAMASDGHGQVAWSAVIDVPVTGTAPGQTATVTFGPWRSDLGALQVTATNPPAGGGDLTVLFDPRRNGRPYSQSATAAGRALAPTGATVLSVPYARDFWTSALLWTGVIQPDGSGAGLVETVTSFASRTIDLAGAPPRLSGLTVTEQGGRLVASWDRVAPDAGLDGTVLRADWSSASASWWWRVMLPPGRTSFTFPAPPAEAAGFLPEAGASLFFADVTSYDVPTAGSYGDFRARHASFLTDVPDLGPTAVRFTGTVLLP